MRRELVSKSKFLSLVLRHKPETIGISLDEHGWVAVDALLGAASANGTNISLEELHEIVETNDKRRFALSGDGTRIRASQGHSVEVDLSLRPVQPPQYLYHGTATRFLASIQDEGLRPMQRRHVHLSPTAEAARGVGTRHGKPVVLLVHASRMRDDGHEFYLSANGVWLTGAVPWDYLEPIDRPT